LRRAGIGGVPATLHLLAKLGVYWHGYTVYKFENLRAKVLANAATDANIGIYFNLHRYLRMVK